MILKKKTKKEVRAILALKIQMWLENKLAHLWRGSTQIEYSSQKKAHQV